MAKYTQATRTLPNSKSNWRLAEIVGAVFATICIFIALVYMAAVALTVACIVLCSILLVGSIIFISRRQKFQP